MAKHLKNIDIKDVAAKLGQNMAWVFVVIFLVLVAFEGLEIKKSVGYVLTANSEPPSPPVQRGARVDFEGYDRVLQLKQGTATFFPTSTPQVNPFLPQSTPSH